MGTDWNAEPTAFIATTLRTLANYSDDERQQEQRSFYTAAAERLEALEEIRQRVADGWSPLPGEEEGEEPVWGHATKVAQPVIRPEVAAVLWPTTDEDTGDEA